MVMPGKGPGISISASLLICHHKQPLRGALEEGHRLLDAEAKEGGGRNALAIRLRKRSGHERDFTVQWDAVNPFFPGENVFVVDSFSAIQNGVDNGILSGSLIYRLAEPEFGVMVGSVLGTLKRVNDANMNSLAPGEIEHLIQILAREIGHSGTLVQKYPGQKEKRQAISRTFAAHMAGITISKKIPGTSHGSTEGQGRDYLSERWIYKGQVPAIARYLSRGDACAKEGEII